MEKRERRAWFVAKAVAQEMWTLFGDETRAAPLASFVHKLLHIGQQSLILFMALPRQQLEPRRYATFNCCTWPLKDVNQN